MQKVRNEIKLLSEMLDLLTEKINRSNKSEFMPNITEKALILKKIKEAKKLIGEAHHSF